MTKNVTAAIAIKLARQGLLALDEPLSDQLSPALLDRWSTLDALLHTTPRQLLARTSGVPNYFGEDTFMAQVRKEPSRRWDPAELVDHAATYGTPSFAPGQGFAYSDTGYVITGILVQEKTGQPLHEVYRGLVFDPLGMDGTWLAGHEPARTSEVADRYTGEFDWATLDPTIDWAGGGLVTTTSDLARFVRGLWSESIVDSDGLCEMTRWTPGVSSTSATCSATSTMDWVLGATRSRGSSSWVTPASSEPLPSTRPSTTQSWPAPTTVRRWTAGPW